jgi:putative aldouronate transport system substrate-binding protein
MMKKRILFAALAVVLTLAMLVGCQSSPPPVAATTAPAGASDAPQPTVAAPTENPEIKDFVKLTWYVIGNGDEPDKDVVLKAVNDYLKPIINAEVDMRTIGWGDYNDKMNPLLAAGDSSFDLMFIASWAANYNSNASSGFLRDLAPLIDKYGQDILAATGPDFLKGCQIAGKQYAIPMNKEQAHTWGPILQRSLVEKYKIDLTTLKTWKDMEPVLAQIKAGEPDIIPLAVVQGEAPFMALDWDRLVDDNTPGALYPNNDASNNVAINNYTAPESVEMYKMMRDWFTKGYISPDASTQTNFNNEISTGKYFCIDQSLKPNKYVEMSGSTGIEWVQVSLSAPVMSNREATGSLQAMPKNGKNPERAMMFLNLLYKDSFVLNTLYYGIEGKHYLTTSRENTITGGPDQKKYNPGNPWRFGNQFIEFITVADSADVWNQYKEFNTSALPLNSLGFNFDGTNVQNELAATRAIVTKYYLNLFNGSGLEPVDTIVANFDKELKDAGVEALLAEETKQYQAFLAAK